MHLIVVVATVCYLVMLPLLFLAALGLDQYRARRFRRRLEARWQAVEAQSLAQQRDYRQQWQILQAQIVAQLQTLQADQAARQQEQEQITKILTR
jgi:hypothetical protein